MEERSQVTPNQHLMVHQVPLVRRIPAPRLIWEPQMTERLSNNLWIVYLEERSQKKIYQMHWTAAAIPLPLNKKLEIALPLCTILTATDTTPEAGSGSTDEPEATSDDEGTSDDDGDNSADNGTSEDDDGPN